MNPWLFAFTVSLVIFLAVVDWSQIHLNIYGGVLALTFELIEGYVAYYGDLWKYDISSATFVNSIQPLKFVNIYIMGIAFTMGIIFFQLIPKKFSLQFIHSFLWTFFFALLNAISSMFGILTYVHFAPYRETHIIGLFLSISWFKTFYLQNKSMPNLDR